MIERLMTIGEVAEVLHMSEAWVWKLKQSGDLPYLQLGGRSSKILFDPADVRGLIEERKCRALSGEAESANDSGQTVPTDL